MSGLFQIIIGLLMLTAPQSWLTKARGSEADAATKRIRTMGAMLAAIGGALAVAHFASP
jgi:uncharacterized protein YjeT (DUF2065 family)